MELELLEISEIYNVDIDLRISKKSIYCIIQNDYKKAIIENGFMKNLLKDVRNKSIEFFKEKEQFDYDEFTKEVLQDENVIESFSNFKSDYEQEMQVSISEDFAINESAVKFKR